MLQILLTIVFCFQTTPASFRPVPEPPLISSHGNRLKDTGKNSPVESLTTANLQRVSAKTTITLRKSVMEAFNHTAATANKTSCRITVLLSRSMCIKVLVWT